MLTVKAIPVIEGNEKIDGFHLMWDPFLRGHLPLAGYSIYRRKSSGRDKPTCRLIDGTALQTLHSNFFLYFNTTKFNRIAFRPMHPDFPNWPHPVNNAISALAAPLYIFAYDVYFSEPLFGTSIVVTIKPDIRFMFAVAYKEGRVVRSKFSKDNLAVEFEEPVDKITIYIPGMAETIRVCYTEVNPGKDEDWQLIKKNLCLPFAGFGENVTTAQQEYQLFQSRLNDDLAPDVGHFNDISSLLKDTSNRVTSSLLPATSVMKFIDTPGSNGQRMNAAPFNMLQMFSVYHNWRMGLGFGYLDKQDLEENQIYDYKITANFHKNVDEAIFDFHTIPLNTRVGPAFSLDNIFIHVDAATVVDSFSSANDIFVKGIRVNGAIKFTFPQDIANFALYCVPEPGATIRVNGNFGTIAVKERVEIKLNSATDNVILLGKFSLVGIAYPSLATGTNPRDIITETGYCLHQKFTNTKRLLAPATLNAVNLQTSTVPGEHKAPEGLGFRLSWEHPSGYEDAIDPALWPPDVPFPPPAELGYYKLEYMNSSMNPADHWHLHDENADADPTGIILPGDDYYATPLPVSFGADLLKVFPPGRLAGGTFTTFQRFKHLLENKSGNITAVPGAFYKYRIWTVDLAGRISLLATETVPARLEKRLPPPAPAGLADKYILPNPDPGYNLADPRTELRPQNVYTRVLLASSSNLTTQERSLLGTRDHITILTWTWGEEERSLDSYAKEFRIYIRTNEHGLINGNLAAAATANGTDFNMEVTLDTAVVANEFEGGIITLNRVVFRIVSHDAGTSVTIRVSPPRTQPGAVPMPGTFKLYRRAFGEESRPLSWSQRIAVVPLTANKVYQYILETGHLVGANNLTGLEGIGYDITPLGSSTRCWLGVSAADTEPYVDDQLTTGTFSLRVGNEGSIVTAPVQVKFIGRPEFNPPPPLDDVDTLPLDEVNSDNLLFAVTPLDQLPFLQATDNLQIERITGTDLLSLLIVTDNAIALSDAENRDIVTDWLLNPADETELRNAFANSAKPIPAKFIWAIAKKSGLHLDELWKVITNTPVNCASLFKDYIPNRTDRYIYRAKLTNELGIASEAAAMFPAVWRTKNKTIPPAVTMDAWQLTETVTGASAAPIIKLDAGIAVSVKGILVFPGSLGQSVTDEELRMAALVKIPNRPDFLSEQLYRVNVNGNLVEPIFVPVAEAELETAGPSTVYSWNQISFNFPFEHTACVWAAAVSNDNVISKLGSYRKQFTGLTPPVVPDLSAAAVLSGLQLTFNAGGDGSLLYRIEKLVNGDYTPVSGWFVGAAGANEVKQPMPAVTTSYRLKIRLKNNREYVGNPVEIII